MSEKQLTVAELMERAAKEGRVEAPRRRRRSLEEGGVSVAELTGSIPVVKAVPSDSRHSAEPIDAPFPRQPKPSAAKEKEASKSAESTETSTPQDHGSSVGAVTTAGSVASATAKLAEPKPSVDSSFDTDSSDTPPWMTDTSSISDGTEEASESPEYTSEYSDTPPWLSTSLPEEETTTDLQEDDTPPWMTSSTASPEEEEETPPWLITTPEPSALQEEEEEETPPWLAAALEEKEKQKAEQSREYEETPPWIITEAEEEAAAKQDDDIPPWMIGSTDAADDAEYQDSFAEETPPWLQPEPVSQPEPEPEDIAEESQVPGAAAASTPSTDKTMVISVINENDPVRLTTGAFEAITPDQAAAAAASSSGASASTAPHAEETTQMPVVEDEQEDSYATEAVDESNIERPDLASVIPMGGQANIKESKKRDRKSKAASPSDIPGPSRTPGPSPTPGPASATETQVQPAVETPIPDPNGIPEAKPLPVKVEAREKEGKISFIAIAGMTLLAIIVGVALFLGFEMLWSSLPKWAVSLLALAVTGGIVGIVHALRTERDFLSMGLAGLAGLAMTFGPMAVAGL
ncbi:hypothetical protein [Corynebacterium freiburgense]|uniref:hypothetical protein n=1 Tax=Corynebacterium freiburgense TaxID=556548 RepID=UPI000414732E|nr:hypothetical protein [Corynebacterium freiburgense]WJZ01554.1 hypothetical protein CFREI_01230 [Corynebacterium freiburgense]